MIAPKADDMWWFTAVLPVACYFVVNCGGVWLSVLGVYVTVYYVL